VGAGSISAVVPALDSRAVCQHSLASHEAVSEGKGNVFPLRLRSDESFDAISTSLGNRQLRTKASRAEFMAPFGD
jgi:hypothetical protein